MRKDYWQPTRHHIFPRSLYPKKRKKIIWVPKRWHELFHALFQNHCLYQEVMEKLFEKRKHWAFAELFGEKSDDEIVEFVTNTFFTRRVLS